MKLLITYVPREDIWQLQIIVLNADNTPATTYAGVVGMRYDQREPQAYEIDLEEHGDIPLP